MHLTCSYNFHGYKRPRKLKTANISPRVFEAKTRKFGDAKIFHFTVSVSQFGFRSGRSCILQLIDVMEDWSQYIEDDESWDIIYLDFSKALDTVAHKRLIHEKISI